MPKDGTYVSLIIINEENVSACVTRGFWKGCYRYQNINITDRLSVKNLTYQLQVH